MTGTPRDWLLITHVARSRIYRQWCVGHKIRLVTHTTHVFQVIQNDIIGK